MTKFHYADVVVRTEPGKDQYSVSENIRRHGYERAFSAMKSTLISLDLEVSLTALDRETITRLEDSFTKAEQLGLLLPGGVPPRNFLGLWMLHHLLAPVHYLESGYYRGSSLLAALGNTRLRHLHGFDPDPSNLLLSDFPEHVDVRLEGKDFSEAAPENKFAENALVYFDDHINTARRILEAQEKGYQRLVFDDSCGLTGTSQRHWPSMPSLYFILHAEDLRSNDFVEWPSPIGRARDGTGGKGQLRVTFDAELIDLCRHAKNAISNYAKLPDLSDNILWRSAATYPDVSQHLVLLKCK